jgi:hypothetical protein
MQEAPSYPDLKYPWLRAVFDALIEYHPDRIQDTISVAKKAVSERLNQYPIDQHEVLALRNAILALQTLFRRNSNS